MSNPRFDLKQLANFVKVVDAGSITRASTMIGLAQPALTLQIARLEDALGAQLLVRSARGVQPTEAGALLYRHAQATLQQVAQIPLLLHAKSRGPAGLVSVGLPTSYVALFGVPLARSVRERFPGVKLRLIEGESSLLRELVMNQRLDMCIANEHVARHELERLLLYRQRVALLTLVGAGPATAPGATITLSQALAQASILPGPGNPVRQVIEAALDGAALPDGLALEMNSMQATAFAVAQGGGSALTIWTPLAAAPASSGLVFIPVVEPAMSLDVVLYRSKTAPTGPAAQAIHEALAAVVAERTHAGDWPGAEPVSGP